jgi:clan AA aspartic protease (TIGR02281 family)
MVDLRPQMTAKINGTDVRFMVDSGAFWSVISPASAAELNLSTRPTPIEFFMRGANGSASTSVTKIKDFTLGGVTIHDIDFLVGGSQIDSGSVGVRSRPRRNPNDEAGGLVQQDGTGVLGRQIRGRLFGDRYRIKGADLIRDWSRLDQWH